jgi:hypothetical protein
MTNGTDSSASDGPVPASLETLRSIGGKPFKRRSPFFTSLINVGSSSLGGSRGLLFRPNELELIMVARVLDDRVDGSRLKILVPGTKLIKNIRIT